MYVNRRKSEMGERNQSANHSVNVVGQLKTELMNTAKVCVCVFFFLFILPCAIQAKIVCQSFVAINNISGPSGMYYSRVFNPTKV